MSAFSKALALYIDVMANPRASVTDEYNAAEKLCAAIETKEQAQIAFGSMDDASRIIGNHVADNATDSAYHPGESSEGCAYLVLDDDSAIWAEWDSYGFWHVTIITRQEAYKEMEAKALEYEISEEYDADSDETH